MPTRINWHIPPVDYTRFMLELSGVFANLVNTTSKRLFSSILINGLYMQTNHCDTILVKLSEGTSHNINSNLSNFVDESKTVIKILL